MPVPASALFVGNLPLGPSPESSNSLAQHPITLARAPSTSFQLERVIRRVLPMLRDAKIVADQIASSNSALDGLSEAQLIMFQESDSMLPLRKKALGRARMNAAIDHAFAITPEGLFSMMVFRFVTFNSEAFIRAPADLQKVCTYSLLSSLPLIKTILGAVQFSTRMDRLQERVTIVFFRKECRKQFLLQQERYRQTVPIKPPLKQCVQVLSSFIQLSLAAVNHRAGFFHACLEMDAGSPVCPQGQITFSGRFHIVSFHRRHVSIRHGLLADMRRYGLFFLHKLDLGGVTGLRRLGYLPLESSVPPPTLDKATQAFSQFYNDVSRQLTNAEQLNLSWNTIITEHTLCKIKGMGDRSYYL